MAGCGFEAHLSAHLMIGIDEVYAARLEQWLYRLTNVRCGLTHDLLEVLPLPPSEKISRLRKSRNPTAALQACVPTDVVVVQMRTQHGVDLPSAAANRMQIFEKRGLDIGKYGVLALFVAAEAGVDQDSSLGSRDEEGLERQQNFAPLGRMVGYQPAMPLDALRGPFEEQIGGRVDQRPHLDDPRNAGATDLPMTNEICAHDLPAQALAAPYRRRGLSSPAYLDDRWRAQDGLTAWHHGSETEQVDIMTQEFIGALRNQPYTYHPGWGGPEYTSWQDEQLSWKNTCYIGDWSFLMDIEVSGSDALRLFRETAVNSFEKFEVGQAKHVIQCNQAGKVIAEGVLMRMAADVFRTQSTPALYSAFLLSKGGYEARWRHLDTFQFQVSGPKALAVCEQATGESLRDVGFMRFKSVQIAGRPVYALRQGMAGEIGFELHGDRNDAAIVHGAVMEAGKAFGIRRLGHRTAMINHLEAAFPTGMWHYLADMFSPELAGYGPFVVANFDIGGLMPALRGSFEGRDLSDYFLSPLELGWGKSVKFDHEFVGRQALEQEAAAPRRKRVTLELDPADVIAIYASLFETGEPPFLFMDIPHQTRFVTWADAVMKDGRCVGISSVPGYSLHFRKMLTLAFLDVAQAAPGNRVEIIWGDPGSRQTRIRATVAPAPYKQDTRRSDLQAMAAGV